MAIGVTTAGLDRLLAASGLQIVKHYPGSWKETPGVYFQDVLILRRQQSERHESDAGL